MGGAGKFMNNFPTLPETAVEGEEYMYQEWIIVSPDSYNFK